MLAQPRIFSYANAMREYFLQPSTCASVPPLPPSTIDADLAEAILFLHLLVDEKHPLTGMPLPQESCYRSTRVIAALRLAIEALEKTAKKKSKPLPKAAGKSWNQEEDQLLVIEFEKETSIADLAQKYHRSTGAIRSRLMKLGKLNSVSHNTAIAL